MANEYLEGNFAPVSDEVSLPCPDVEGEIPSDLAGYFLRNGPNAQFEPVDLAQYHPFDGDGMIHQVQFADGKATYRNRWIETSGLLRERASGKALWPGFNTIGKIEPPPGESPMKNLANTALAFHGEKLLATWEGGAPYGVSLPEMDTLGEETFAGGWTHAVSAHPKVDPRTGELIIFCYSPAEQPYVRYGVADKNGKVTHATGVELAGAPVMIHDMAITKNHSLILDMPVTFSIERVMNGGQAFDWEPENGTRIGILPRYGDGSEVKWFDVESGYIFHVFNAWEEGDDIVLNACKTKRTSVLVDDENPDDQNGRLHRYRFNLTSGKVEEGRVNDTPLEFSRINETMIGEETRYGYASRFCPGRGLVFNGMIKHDREGDRLDVLELGEKQLNQEIVFAPRVGSSEEDDGYVIGFVHDETDDHAECWVIDARKFTDGPIARVRMPRRVPYGFHSHWVAA